MRVQEQVSNSRDDVVSKTNQVKSKSRTRPVTTDSRLVVAGRGVGGRGWTKWVKGSRRYRLLVTECLGYPDERHTIRHTANGVVMASAW